MASLQATLGATPSVIPLDAPTGRIVVTMISGAAEAVITCDGSNPAAPTATEDSSTKRVLAGVVGAQVVLQPPLFGNYMAVPTVRAAALAGSPVVQIEW